MAWLPVQDTPGSNTVNSTTSGTTLSCTAFGSAVTIGNIVVVFLWGGNGANAQPSSISVTDNGATPNTYTKLFLEPGKSIGSGWCAIFAGAISSNPLSGNLIPKVTVGDSSTLLNICASEFSGGTATTDGTAIGANASTTTAPKPGSMSTSVAGSLLLACMADDSGSNPDTITTPSGYTSTGKQTNGASQQCGNGCWQILTGTVTGNNPAWNSQPGWSACQAALQVASGGVTDTPQPTLIAYQELHPACWQE